MQTKDDLIEEMKKVVGYVPRSTREILNVLVNPKLIDLTQDYIHASYNELNACEDFIRIFDMSLGCMGELGHDDDHYCLFDDDTEQIPVKIKWGRKRVPE